MAKDPALKGFDSFSEGGMLILKNAFKWAVIACVIAAPFCILGGVGTGVISWGANLLHLGESTGVVLPFLANLLTPALIGAGIGATTELFTVSDDLKQMKQERMIDAQNNELLQERRQRFNQPQQQTASMGGENNVSSGLFGGKGQGQELAVG